MANSHSLFQVYNSAIKLPDAERELLKQARNSLRKRMQEVYGKFSEAERKTHSIEFQSQGSFVMDTIIKPHNGEEFDLDDGVYFQGNLTEEQRPNTKIFHDLIIKAIDKNNEIEEIVDKDTCVRVKYQKNYGNQNLNFHIDIPIYYAEKLETPELAHKKEGWVESSPVEFIAWFETKAKSGFEKAYLYESLKYAEPYEKWLSDIRKQDCQLRRIVRYLKAWADLKKGEMPCGIIMSILAANNYSENERDDIALRDTLTNINTTLEINGFTCIRPTPKYGEDLFAKSSLTEKQYFKTALESFIESANFAINNPNYKESCLKWQRHLGHRFPCHLAKDEIEGAIAYNNSPIKNDSSRSALND
ncbi:MAG: hypothetical protein WCT77_13260 [Bacteroidota bacterium]